MLWEACSLRPARWLWQLAFEMGVVEVDGEALCRLARATEKSPDHVAQVSELALGVVRGIARLDETTVEVTSDNAGLVCEAWVQSFVATGSLSHGVRDALGEASAGSEGRRRLPSIGMCNDLLSRPQRTVIRSAIGADVVCRTRRGGQTTLHVEPGAYVDVTHIDAEQLQLVMARERKRYRTVRTIERPTRSRDNLTYLSHIWHSRVYENREDPHMVDVLLDLENERGERRRRYLTLPEADVRPDKSNPNVRYAVVRTRELMLHWYEAGTRKVRFERIGTEELIGQMRRSYETYRAKGASAGAKPSGSKSDKSAN